MAHYGMVIDSKNCVACNACAVACKMENNLPNGVWWNKVYTEGNLNRESPSGVYPQPGEQSALHMENIPVACQHCENPACVRACPTTATYKDEETGIVRQDYSKCIGCRMCMMACPYGVRAYNDDEPQYYLDFAVGSAAVAPHQKHTVEKCQLCYHRTEQGLQPACVEACTARIRFYGDFDDPESEVSKLLAENDATTLLPEKGTRPSVYYLR